MSKPHCVFCPKSHPCLFKAPLSLSGGDPKGSLKNLCIALPIFKRRVSPVLDTCALLFLLMMYDRRQGAYRTITLKGSIYERAKRIQKLGIKVIVCGAVSEPFYNLLRESGVELICGITGDIGEVIEAYCSGKLEQPRFRMPGFD